MKKSILLFVSALFACSFINAQEEEVQSQTLFFQGDSTSSAIPMLTTSAADSAYVNGDYITAAAIYEELIATKGVSPELYMNLGNAYFKMDEIAKAILNYERAYLMDPSDADVRFNLEIAKTKIVDKDVTASELFFVTWVRQLAASMNVDQWGILTVILVLLMSVCIGIFVLSKNAAFKKSTFIIAIVLLFAAIMCFCFAKNQKNNLIGNDTAIIMSPSVTVKSTPNDNGTDLFIIHEGSKVNILDNGMKDWIEISLNDGNEGWVHTDVLEII